MPTPDTAADEARQATESRYRALFDAVGDAVIVCTVTELGIPGPVLDLNAAAVKMCGVQRNQAVGRSIYELFWADPSSALFAARGNLATTGRTEFIGAIRTASGGVLTVEASAQRLPADGGELQMTVLRDVTEQVRLEAERADALTGLGDAHARLEALSRRLVVSQEEERQAIARELHDEVGQSLTLLAIHLDLAAPDPANSATILAARSLVTDLLTRIRRISLDLRPTMLDDLGILPALLWLFERFTAHTAVAVEFAHTDVERRFPPCMETAAFRIVQEALTNAARHSGAPVVSVSLSVDASWLTIEVVDRGRGFEPRFGRASAPGGHRPVRSSTGLDGMRERAALVGGTLTVETGPSGTTVLAHLPLGPR